MSIDIRKRKMKIRSDETLNNMDSEIYRPKQRKKKSGREEDNDW